MCLFDLLAAAAAFKSLAFLMSKTRKKREREREIINATE